jgi:hypothetical protein
MCLDQRLRAYENISRDIECSVDGGSGQGWEKRQGQTRGYILEQLDAREGVNGCTSVGREAGVEVRHRGAGFRETSEQSARSRAT